MDRRLRRRSVSGVIVIAALMVAFTTQVVPAQEAQKRVPAEKTRQPSIDEMLLFFPAKYPAGNWTPPGLKFTEVTFSAADQTKLHGWYCPCDKPRATILIAHGNAGALGIASGIRLAARGVEQGIVGHIEAGLGAAT